MSMYEKGSPYAVEVKAGETSYICQCGLTGNAPFCDGSHSAAPGTAPLAHTADQDGALYVCGCGKTGNGPFCDGSHK